MVKLKCLLGGKDTVMVNWSSYTMEMVADVELRTHRV